jgi:hypothetical protein
VGSFLAPLALLAAIACLTPRSSVAANVTVSFSGTIDSLSILEDPFAPWIWHGYDGSFTVGSPFSGSLTFDDSTSDSNADVQVGNYSFDTPPFTAILQVGGYTLSSISGRNTAQIFNDSFPQTYPNGLDEISLFVEDVSVLGAPGFPSSESYFVLELEDFTGSALGSDALASVPFSLAPWDQARISFSLRRADSLSSFVSAGPIASQSVVPEPSTALLIWLGATGLAIRRAFAAAA